MRRNWLGIVGLFSLLGCEERPRAPSLDNAAVFQDSTLGVRFIAPDGWTMSARSAVPPGQVKKPIRIVAYQKAAIEGAVELDLYIADYPASQPLVMYLQDHPISPERWEEKGSATEVEIDGVTATKHLQVSSRNPARQREIWEIRRQDERVYLFILTAIRGERSTREQGQRAVQSIQFIKP